MKHYKKITYLIIGIITLYAGYSYSLTIAQRNAKKAQFNQILTQASSPEQLKPAQTIINELKKTSAARDAQTMEIDLAKRQKELESQEALSDARQGWQAEKNRLEVELKTATQNANRFEKELELSLKEIEKLQKEKTSKIEVAQESKLEASFLKKIEEKEKEIKRLQAQLISAPQSQNNDIQKQLAECEKKRAELQEETLQVSGLNQKVEMYKKEQFKIEAILGKDNFEKAKKGETIDVMKIADLSGQPIEELKKSRAELVELLAKIGVQNLEEAKNKIQALQAAPTAENVKELTAQAQKLGEEKTALEEKLKAATEEIKLQDNLLTDCDKKAKDACKQVENQAEISNKEIKKIIGELNFNNIQKIAVNPLLENPNAKIDRNAIFKLDYLPDESKASKKYEALTSIEEKYKAMEPEYEKLKNEITALQASQNTGSEMLSKAMVKAVGEKNFNNISNIAQEAHIGLDLTIEDPKYDNQIKEAIKISDLPAGSDALEKYKKLEEEYEKANVFDKDGKFKGNINKNITEYIGEQGIPTIQLMMQRPNAEIGEIETRLKLDALYRESNAYKEYEQLKKDAAAAASPSKGMAPAVDFGKELAAKDTEIATLKAELENQKKESTANLEASLKTKNDEVKKCNDQKEKALNFAKNIIANSNTNAETLIPATFGLMLGESEDKLTKTHKGLLGTEYIRPDKKSFDESIAQAVKNGDSRPLLRDLRAALKE